MTHCGIISLELNKVASGRAICVLWNIFLTTTTTSSLFLLVMVVVVCEVATLVNDPAASLLVCVVVENKQLCSPSYCLMATW